MRSLSISRYWLVAALLVFVTASGASAAQVVSVAKNVRAVMQERGFFLAPAGTNPIGFGTADLAPIQSFEIVRPRGERITIGRLYTSCTCVRLEAPKRTFERGERAVLNLRNVIATPPAGQTYAIYVQITSPIKATLRFDTFVQSSQFVPAPAPLASGNIEVIVPASETAPEEKKAEDTAETAADKAGTEPDSGDKDQADSPEKPADASGAPDEKAAETKEAETDKPEEPAPVQDDATAGEDLEQDDEPTVDDGVVNTEDVLKDGDAADIEDAVDPGVEAETL